MKNFWLVWIVSLGMVFMYECGKTTQHGRDLQIIEQALDQQQDISCDSEVENR